MRKVRTWKKLCVAMVATGLLGSSVYPAPVIAGEKAGDQRFIMEAASRLAEGRIGSVVRSTAFPDKKSVYTLMEQACRRIDTPEMFLENQCYLTYRMITLAGEGGYCLSAEVERYDKKNDLDAGQIVKDLEVEGCSDLEIAIRVHEWLTDMLIYGPSQESLGACLEVGYGKCDDYSMIYASVMNAAGVETRCMDGVPDGTLSGHMWNMVCLENEWYLCDVTNDDLNGTYQYFMRSLASEDVGDYLGSYLDGFRLCNGVDDYIAYDLADSDYFCQQTASEKRSINLASVLGIADKMAKRAEVHAVLADGGKVKRPKKTPQKIRVTDAGGVVYGSYVRKSRTIHYLIQIR